MGKLLWSGGFFYVFWNYNLLQWIFVCDFQCAVVGLLLIDNISTLFYVFYPYIQSAILFSSLNITYMHGFWAFICLFGGDGDIGAVFDAQSLSLVIYLFYSWICGLETCYNSYLIYVIFYLWVLSLYLGESPAFVVMLFISSL